MASILGRLERLALNTPHYIAAIERLDIDTIHQHRHLELQVAPAAVDKILGLNGTLEPLIFIIRDGQVIDVKRA
jgi:hypothetical protein